MVFVVSESSQFVSIKDLINKAKTSEVTCGISNSHGEIELRRMNQTFGTKFVPVAYKGTGQLIPDVLGGHVPCAYDQIAAYTALESRVRFLATSKKIRNDIPALDTVLPKYQFETWYAAAIPNNSILLKDTSVVDVVRNWTQDRELTTPLVEKSFVVVKTDPTLNARAVKETESYKK
jgi:tripartite-type tricarboxylate transporter receptor subunit TctC